MSCGIQCMVLNDHTRRPNTSDSETFLDFFLQESKLLALMGKAKPVVHKPESRRLEDISLGVCV